MERRTRPNKLSHSRKGFILVSVLMLGMLLISCATVFTWSVRTQVKSAWRERDILIKRSMAHVLINSVLKLMAEIAVHTNCDSPTQRWYQPFVFALPDMGVWVMQITPLDDKIPLRNIFLPDGNTMRREYVEVWREMWNTKLNHRELEQRVLDFLDKNKRPRVGSTEADTYINRVPYDISELLLMSGDISAGILYGNGSEMGLSDYCTVYSDGKINLNVAPVHVMELLPGLDVGDIAHSIEEYRRENALESLRDIQNIPGASAKTSTQLTNIAAFKSRFFSIKLECLETEGDEVSSFTVIADRTSQKIVRWEEI